MQTLSVVSSLASLILSVVAISLSLYLYTQGKNVEREVTRALEGIRAQVDTLQRLAGRQMDRLIKGVTEPAVLEPVLLFEMVAAIKEIPGSIASQLRGRPGADTAKALETEVILCYITIYYYTAVANVAWQPHLPPLTNVQPDDAVKLMVDQTYGDFQHLERILARADPAALQASPLYHLYEEARSRWKPFVKDSTQVYAERSQAAG